MKIFKIIRGTDNRSRNYYAAPDITTLTHEWVDRWRDYDENRRENPLFSATYTITIDPKNNSATIDAIEYTRTENGLTPADNYTYFITEMPTELPYVSLHRNQVEEHIRYIKKQNAEARKSADEENEKQTSLTQVIR